MDRTLLTVLDSANKLVSHLDEHYFDEPRFAEDQEFQRLFVAFHDSLADAAARLNALSDEREGPRGRK